MVKNELKKVLAGLCISSLVAGASLTGFPGEVGAASG